MSIFITGGTGFIGSYVVAEFFQRSDDRMVLLTRASSHQAATEKLWKAMQLHMDADTFDALMKRVSFALGDLHAPGLGLDEVTRKRVEQDCTSVVHIAASLNRKSAKACLNTNLRGTLSVIKLARAIADAGRLRRYSHVSTVAVAGERDREVVHEDASIEWNRSDYDPYGRTKKFCEHMAHELLPDVQKTIFRPSIVLGDSRFPETTQFDMARALVGLADMPAIPLDPSVRLDIVPADFVGRAIAEIHLKPEPRHDTYHLSSGTSSLTAKQVAQALEPAVGRKLRFAKPLKSPFQWVVRGMNRLPRKTMAAQVGALLKVFLPYLHYDTVFDNRRICDELGIEPTPFDQYGAGLYQFCKDTNFRYPHRPLPEALAKEDVA